MGVSNYKPYQGPSKYSIRPLRVKVRQPPPPFLNVHKKYFVATFPRVTVFSLLSWPILNVHFSFGQSINVGGPLPLVSISHINRRRQSLPVSVFLRTLRFPRIPGIGFPRTLYAVQSEQSYCFATHATNRVVLDKIFSNANSYYFRGKLKIETVKN